MPIRQFLESMVGLWKRRVSCASPQSVKPIRTRAPTTEEWYFHKYWGRQNPLTNSRFVEQTTCGMGVSIRSERWGVVRGVDVGRAERGLVYDGNQSQEMREWYRKKGQDTWLEVWYDDGKVTFEPLWDCVYPTLWPGHPEQGKDFYIARMI